MLADRAQWLGHAGTYLHAPPLLLRSFGAAGELGMVEGVCGLQGQEEGQRSDASSVAPLYWMQRVVDFCPQAGLFSPPLQACSSCEQLLERAATVPTDCCTAVASAARVALGHWEGSLVAVLGRFLFPVETVVHGCVELV